MLLNVNKWYNKTRKGKRNNDNRKNGKNTRFE